MAVKTKPFKTHQDSGGILSFLVDINLFLEKIPYTIEKFFDRAVNKSQDISQKGVDMICEWCAWRVNTWVESCRQQVIKALHKQYGFATSMVDPMEDLKEAFSNPMKTLGAVVSVVKKIISILIGPLKIVYDFLKQLVSELLRLAKNLANIAAVLPPSTPPDHDLSYDKFKLNVKSIGMADIKTDPGNLPSPEEMFEEPIVPFSKEYFDALKDEAKKPYKEELPFYTLPVTYTGPLVNLYHTYEL